VSDDEQPDEVGPSDADASADPGTDASLGDSDAEIQRVHRPLPPYLANVHLNYQRIFGETFAPLAHLAQYQTRLIRDAMGSYPAGELSRIAADMSRISDMFPRADLSKIAGMLPPPELWQNITAKFAPVIERVTRWLPANWQGLPDLDFDATVNLINGGIPLIWVPRAAIVADLVSAPDAAGREAILAASLIEISEDCAAVLADVGRPDLKPLASLAMRRPGWRASRLALKHWRRTSWIPGFMKPVGAALSFCRWPSG
jgi:hypothetical protein